MSLQLNELKALYDRGLALIYLHPRDKRPIENGWTTGPRKTWAELKRDFKPDYNVGVRLGEPSKLENGYLCCIDVDVKDPAYKKEALKKLKEIIKNESHPLVLSGSGNGSRHVYAVSREPFKMVEIEKHKGKWEICAYSTGRQMVLPPSMHPSGVAYAFKQPINGTRLPTLKPGKFRALKQSLQSSSKQNVQSSSKTLFKALDVNLDRLDVVTIQKITDGAGVSDRSAELLSIAMKMCRAKYSDNEILSVLSDENNWISGAAFDHTQSLDRARAVKWLDRYTVQKARFETDPMRLFEGQPDYSKAKRLKPETVTRIKEETNTVLPDAGQGGKPKSSLRNVVHILEHFMGGGLVGYNEFSCRPYFLKDTLYGGRKGKEVVDGDDLNLIIYIAEHYRFEPSQDTCFKAHTFLANRHRFHPVKTYLESLEWDGVARLDSWLGRAFRASGPEDYVEAVSRKTLVAAVARVYEPGIKFDHMVVLEGNQGEGKSMTLSLLVGQALFTDSLGDIHNKDVVDQMIGKWLIEVSELDSIRGREAQAVKAFVSRQVDRVRLSYARRAQDYPRQCVFIGSTNDKEYLTDETGNRRYWPIKVGRARRKWLTLNRDQLWAEAVWRYELGEKLYLSNEMEAVAKAEQEKRFEVDVWEGLVKETIEKAEQENPPQRLQTIEIYRAITLSVGTPSMAENKRIAKIMHRLGYESKNKRIAKVVAKRWRKTP